MALVLTTATGRIHPKRIEAFQVTFQNLMSRRFAEAPFLRQAILVHLGVPAGTGRTSESRRREAGTAVRRAADGLAGGKR